MAAVNKRNGKVYTLTLNPSLDYIVSVEDFATGGMHRATAEALLPGGKGINVSSILCALGMPSVALGFVAGETGRQLEAMLHDLGLATELIPVAEGMTRINVKLKNYSGTASHVIQQKQDTKENKMTEKTAIDKTVASETATNVVDTDEAANTRQIINETEINGRGPCIDVAAWEKLYQALDKLQPEDILVLSGSAPTGTPPTIYRDIMGYVHKKNPNIRIVVDGAGDLLRYALEEQPFLIKPNKQELEQLLDVRLESKQDVVQWAAKLLATVSGAGAEHVLVSLGSEGAVLVCHNQPLDTSTELARANSENDTITELTPANSDNDTTTELPYANSDNDITTESPHANSADSQPTPSPQEDCCVYTCPAPRGTLVNSVGAGDALLAGFLYSYETTQDLEKALHFSVQVGSACAFTQGLPTRDAVEKLCDPAT